MKTKNFKKKLTLNKNTVAHLNNGELKAAHGGILASIPYTDCFLCPTYSQCATVCDSDPCCRQPLNP